MQDVSDMWEKVGPLEILAPTRYGVETLNGSGRVGYGLRFGFHGTIVLEVSIVAFGQKRNLSVGSVIGWLAMVSMRDVLCGHESSDGERFFGW